MSKNEAYYDTINLLFYYSDLKLSTVLTGTDSKTLELIDKALEVLSTDPYIDILTNYYIHGMTMEDVAETVNLHVTQCYKHRKRLVKRLSIILYGDKGIEKEETTD